MTTATATMTPDMASAPAATGSAVATTANGGAPAAATGTQLATTSEPKREVVALKQIKQVINQPAVKKLCRLCSR